MALITRSEYARQRGVSPEAVRQAILSGRINLIEGKIDPEVADIQWAKNTKNPQAAFAQPKPLIDYAAAPPPPAGPALAPRPDSAITQTIYDLQLSRAKREFHEANLAEMRERQKSGELVELAEVEKTTATIFAQMCNALEGIGDKIGDRMAAESDPFACRTLINDEIAQIRADLAAALTAQADRLQEEDRE